MEQVPIPALSNVELRLQYRQGSNNWGTNKNNWHVARNIHGELVQFYSAQGDQLNYTPLE